MADGCGMACGAWAWARAVACGAVSPASPFILVEDEPILFVHLCEPQPTICCSCHRSHSLKPWNQ